MSVPPVRVPMAEVAALRRALDTLQPGPDRDRLIEEIVQLAAIALVRSIAPLGHDADPLPEPVPLRVMGGGDRDRSVNVHKAAEILGVSTDFVYEHWRRDYRAFARKEGGALRFSLQGLLNHVSRPNGPTSRERRKP